MSDTATYCDLEGWGPETLDQYFESPQRPHLRFFSIDESIPPWRINHITKCGPDVGRYQSMISEEGVHYHQPFSKEMTVGPSWANSHYMNNRGDMALEAVAGNGDIVLHPAGVMGWSHPDPETIKSMQDLYDRTDRAWAKKDSDQPKVRANILNYSWTDPSTGKVRKFIIACGWVLPSVTRREVIEIENAGISGVSTVVATAGGVGVEMITADFVRQGRQTSGQLLHPNLEAAAAETGVPIVHQTFAFDAAEVAAITMASTGEPDMPAPEPYKVTIDSTEAQAELDAVALAFEKRVDEKVASAMKKLGIEEPPPPPPPPTAEERMAALERDLARRADAAQAPDFASIGRTDMADIGDSALSTLLNNQQKEGESREAFHKRLGDAAGWHPDTVRQVLNAQIWCPPRARLEGLARALPGVTVEGLIAAARKDPRCGTRYGD